MDFTFSFVFNSMFFMNLYLMCLHCFFFVEENVFTLLYIILYSTIIYIHYCVKKNIAFFFFTKKTLLIVVY